MDPFLGALHWGWQLLMQTSRCRHAGAEKASVRLAESDLSERSGGLQAL